MCESVWYRLLCLAVLLAELRAGQLRTLAGRPCNGYAYVESAAYGPTCQPWLPALASALSSHLEAV